MAGCGGACTCGRSERPRDPVTLADAVAKATLDFRIIRFTLKYRTEHPNASVDEIFIAAQVAKDRGELV